MSRSRRKTPIIGHTSCPSEKEDKKTWHQRWRNRERATLAKLSPDALGGYLPLLKNQVSSLWSMGKDGHSYWKKEHRVAMADSIAGRKGRNPKECASVRNRLLHKWTGK